ncbi:ergothioneine biosynthesis protein EgtB [Terriglobus aquaticus]|uniref:Ergothioneine biosynthesis protein EgtB n=1 Tax=Terriglobus aquaticus TaxID=940139 RepID=A0ABW9KHF3_9BACT|nr:ergothioneine biosynthesis protein EgtB [Terriglobus aquaticus]
MATTPAAPSLSAAALQLAQHYRTVRAATSSLCATLSAEDQMVQSCPEASPVKWHQAHTSWFFETFVLSPFAPAYRPFHPDFHWLFNSYYKSLGEEIPEKKLRASFSRPSLDQILAYRAHVDAAIASLLANPDLPAADLDSVLRRITLGLNHEQQHLELALTDIKHAFFTNPLQPAFRAQSPDAFDGQAPAQQWIDLEGGLVDIGYPLNSADPLDFCFDNETPRHQVYLQPYAIANRLTTCGEYLAFLNDNGYSRPELWLSEGWDTVEHEAWQAPLYWQRSHDDPHGWRVFTLGGWRNLAELLDTPVCHVSLFEADAFARWRGCRLPTEAEWEHATVHQANELQRQSHPELSEPSSFFPAQQDTPNLLESNTLHPTPATTESLSQLLGPCWQWTATPYIGYPGYKPLPGALGEYNGKFMSSQVILRGASCVTPQTHARATYRNFFSPATRWQFSGIRLARAF